MKFVDIGYQAGIQPTSYWEDNKHFDAITKWTMAAPEAMASRRIAAARSEAGVKVFSDLEPGKKSQCLADAVTK